MHSLNIVICLFAILLVGVSCSNGARQDSSLSDGGNEAPSATLDLSTSLQEDDGSIIHSEPVFETITLDTDGNLNYSMRSVLHKIEHLEFYYQRVGCKSDTCRQEFVTYSAVQYPKDSILQHWLADVLANYYYDATRQLDFLVNGSTSSEGADEVVSTTNNGCRPYTGVLGDGGKAMFDYYQARLWVIGRDRDAETHGPSGRYGCAVYRCWQNQQLASYFVGYSTDDASTPVHQVVTFDRKTGQQLDLTDIIREDAIAEFYDLLAEEAHARHYRLMRKNPNELAIDEGNCDYGSQLQVQAVGFVREGLAVSTSALAFDQWANATHILVVPSAKVADLLKTTFLR